MSVRENGKLELTPEGGAVILDAEGVTVAIAEVPWAKEATGAAVPTSYTVEGNTLTQHVSFDADTAFPVVADPTWWQEWWGYAIKLTKSETANAGGKGGFSAIIGAACGYIPIVHARVACLAIVGFKATSLVTVTQEAARQGRCLQINIPFPVAGVGSSYLTMNFTNVAC